MPNDYRIQVARTPRDVIHNWLDKYISDDDLDTAKDLVLRTIATRILDDIPESPFEESDDDR